MTLFYKDKFGKGDDSPHIDLAKWSDLVIVYPATHNFISKIACGLANDLPSILLTAFRKPVVFFEAMNEAMLENPFYVENKSKVNSVANMFIHDAKYGELANGDIGWGRVWEVDDVYNIIKNYENDFSNLNEKKVLINFGRTKRMIDTVRYISNGSSGTLGKALLDSAKMFTKNYFGFFGDNDLGLKENTHLKYCPTNDDMLNQIKKEFADADIFIATAALTDFKVEGEADYKISKRENQNPTIKLMPDIDVLIELGKIKTKQFLVGFCLLDEIDLAIGYQKLKEKNCDMVIVNAAKTMGAKTMEAKIINRFNDNVVEIDMKEKSNFAIELWKEINKNYELFKK